MDDNFGICQFDYHDYNFAQENGLQWEYPEIANLPRVYEGIVECNSPSKKPLLSNFRAAKGRIVLGVTMKSEFAWPDGNQYTSKHKRRYFWVPADDFIELTHGRILDDDQAILTCFIRPRYPSIVACGPLAGWPQSIPAELASLTLLEAR